MESIKTTGLKKIYGEIKAVDGIDLTVNEGKIFGFTPASIILLMLMLFVFANGLIIGSFMESPEGFNL